MKNLEIENKGGQMILKLNKEAFDESYLVSLVSRLQVEELARKAEFTPDVLSIAEQINQDWWDSYGEQFLKGVRK